MYFSRSGSSMIQTSTVAASTSSNFPSVPHLSESDETVLYNYTANYCYVNGLQRSRRCSWHIMTMTSTTRLSTTRTSKNSKRNRASNIDAALNRIVNAMEKMPKGKNSVWLLNSYSKN
ncbi:hypothetical protein Csa_004107 [Cucumis sativus]|uniref:Uncharacterized protein n=1 Tax=Cucumis sativus TaxID=3659 RepID=A0A0A0KGX6_CUCSA|nr:hypothetical protein Csa_004107 [Cucumis sativus]